MGGARELYAVNNDVHGAGLLQWYLNIKSEVKKLFRSDEPGEDHTPYKNRHSERGGQVEL